MVPHLVGARAPSRIFERCFLAEKISVFSKVEFAGEGNGLVKLTLQTKREFEEVATWTI